ncbi:MAG: Gfo/Idh/MocA family oxidoreductase [Lachnospiraceae bacterium]|nr:Gfo/Idh/MocA family oxidoreductase [Lachnospiraceae bacterium]
MKKLKVGIVGSGMMACNHMDALGRIPGAEVVAIADPYAKSLKEVAENYGVPYTFSDFKEMCENVKPDVIHDCTPNNEHFSINEYAIMNGIGIYSEKPLTVTLEEADKLCDLLKKNPVPNGVNFNYRSNAIVREMRARIRTGQAGSPLLVHGGYLQDWLMYENDYNWRLDSRRGGVSRAVADIGSHWFDTVQLVLDKKITSVYARLLTVYSERLKPLQEVQTFSKAQEEATYERVPVDTEDAGMIMVQFEDGTLGNAVISQVSGGYKNGLSLTVDCAKCSLRWNQEEADHLIIGNRENGVAKVYAASGGMTQDANAYATLPGGHPAGWADALRNNIRLFYNAIQNDTYQQPDQEYATFEDAAYIMKIVEACLKSNQLNRWVSV